MSNPTQPDWLDSLERPLALVMGGGASLGATQVGMLRSLIERGVRPDLLVGTSVGALNAAFMGQRFDVDQLDKLQEIWSDVTREHIFPGVNFLSLARMISGNRRYLASRKGLEELTETYLPAKHADLEIPTTVLASDMLSGEKVLLSDGDLRKHVMISASIPLVFEPFDYDGRTLSDGGVVSNVPVLPARQLGARSMIVLDPGYPCALDRLPRDLLGVVLHIITLMIRHQSYGALHFLADDTQVVYLPPPCPLDVAPHDFSRSAELFDAGYRTAENFLDAFATDGVGVYGHPHFHGEPAG
jgi:NTE family protein